MPVNPQLETTGLRRGRRPAGPRRGRGLVWLLIFVIAVALLGAAALLAATRPPHRVRVRAPRVSPPAVAHRVTPSAKPFAGLVVARLPKPLAVLHPARAAVLITAPRSLAVPILMYHVIDSPPASSPYPGLFVKDKDFIAQLRYLVGHGYQAVSLQRLYEFWHGRASLPRHPLVLSFDDGYRPDFSVVAPLLKELHWPAVLNLIVRNTRPGHDMRPPYVRALIAAGWEIDSHTVHHLDLTTLSPGQLRYELVVSRRELRRLFGVPVNFFCYPAGAYDPAVVAATRAAGYLAATTTNPGLASPSQPYALARIRVAGGESLAEFAAALRDATASSAPASSKAGGQ